MELWNALFDHLSAQIDNGLSVRLLKRISFKECLNNNTIILIAEDPFTKGWFEKNCIPIITKHLENSDLAYTFRVETALTPSRSPQNSIQYDAVNNQSVPKHNPTSSSHTPNVAHDFTFQHFIPGNCNDFAYKAAHIITASTSTKYNPFILVGGMGTGKTHLAQSIVHEYLEKHKSSSVIYTTSEDFTNEFVEHLQKKNMHLFREKYRRCNLLVIDDIQGLQSKNSTTEELENIFNALISNGTQMVFTSDRSINKLKDLNPRLRTRLSGGLSVDLRNPDFETRKAILMDMAQRENHRVDSKILDLIAEAIDQNIRELKSTLLKLFAFADLKKKEISLKLAKEILSNKINIEIPQNISVQDIQKAVATYFGIKPSDIKSSSKLNSKTHPRKIAMYIASKYTKLTSTELGSLFSKSHSTVIRAVHKIETDMPKNANLRKDIDKILLEISDTHVI